MKRLSKNIKRMLCVLLSVIVVFADAGLTASAMELTQTADEVLTEDLTEAALSEKQPASGNEDILMTETAVSETETQHALTEESETETKETATEEYTVEESGEKAQTESMTYMETESELTQTEETWTEEKTVEETLTEEIETETQRVDKKNVLAEDNIAEGKYKDITWVINADGKLTITGNGDFVDDDYFRAPWFEWRKQINSAEVSVTGITDVSLMFFDCENLAEIDLSRLDTSQIVDMDAMFRGCSNLTSLDVTKFDTQNVTNMSDMFSDCSNLTSLDVTKFDTSKVTSMWGMFSGCRSLTSLDVTKFDTSKVTNMSYMFGGCSNLTNLDVTKFDTSKVTNMNYMFYDCSNLTSLDVTDFDTSKVTDMGGMFIDCKKLENLDVSGFDTSKVTDMSQMFDGCNNLTSLDVTKFNTSNVTNMSYMFCMDYSWLAGDRDKISKLSDLDVSNFDTSKVTNMGGMFSGCGNLTSLDVSNFNTSNVIQMNDMFRECLGLTSLDVSNFDTSKVTDMRCTFILCKNLKDLDVSNFDTSKVTDMSYMFSDCYNLEQLDLSNFNTSNVTEMAVMFDNCRSLTNVDLSSFDTKNVKSIGGLFRNCNALEKVDLSSFDLGGISLANLFANCSSLVQVQTPQNVSASIDLPSGTWYDSNENEYTKLPNLPYSILLTKDSKPTGVEERIAVTKQKTTYRQGAKVDVDDLTVRYYKSDGTVVNLKAEEYTTNVNSIGTSTLGKTSLIIEYKNFTATLTLTVVPATKKTVQISGIEAWDSIFNKRPAFYTNNVKVEADGIDITDKVVLTFHYAGTQADGSAYESLTEGPINAGSYVLTVSVADETEEYTGSETYYYTIKKAPLKIMVLDMEVEVNTELPKIEDYNYDVVGLIEGDGLESVPLIKCNITDTSVPGTYEIQAEGASAGMNYEITYQNGTLTVCKTGEEETYYTVTFNLSGKGSDIKQTNIKQNSTITQPADPTAEGFIFTGWYKEQNCITKWNFTTDQVTSDLTLYAGWKVKDDNKDDVNKGDDNKDYDNNNDDNKDDDNNNGDNKDDDNSSDDSSYLSTERQDLSALNASIAGIRPQTYNCDEQEPAVKVTAFVNGRKVTLTEGMDYRVSYKDNINAGTATVTIKGNGEYKGSLTKNYTISPKSVKKLKLVTGALSENEQGSDLSEFPIHIYDGTKRLSLGTDYTLSSAGMTTSSAKVTITGKGNYTGATTAKLTIYNTGSDQIINPDNVRLNTDTAVYTGKAVKTVEPVVIVGSVTLAPNKDYKVQYKNNTNAGTAYVIVTGKGAYKGKVVVPFTIRAASVSSGGLIIKPIPAKTYSGKLQKPAVTVTVQNGGSTKKLVKYRDYKVTYKDNLHAGTATAIITGKGNYAGMKEQIQFTINPQKITKAAVKGTQEKLTLTYGRRALKENTHYEPPVYGEIKKNKVKVTIKGKGDFTGEITKYIKQ